MLTEQQRLMLIELQECGGLIDAHQLTPSEREILYELINARNFVALSYRILPAGIDAISKSTS